MRLYLEEQNVESEDESRCRGYMRPAIGASRISVIAKPVHDNWASITSWCKGGESVCKNRETQRVTCVAS